ncbi:MAG: nitroreductase family protein [Kiritimatiellae bacterium]|nr:nitroreductase family protein [Kiritimatiellia bacterium]
MKNSGTFGTGKKREYVQKEKIIMGYHVLEKGLTMPSCRLGFGREAVLDLMHAISEYENDFGKSDGQVDHASRCVKAYLHLHEDEQYDMAADAGFWNAVKDFCDARSGAPAQMMKFDRDDFFGQVNSPFEVFAKSRHTVRHFAGTVSDETIEKAVDLARTSPSACNRQYVRVHCLRDHKLHEKIYKLQNGNRGFASAADKLLIVTSDLNGLRWHEERNDVFTNAGIFIMNLMYALHYNRLGCCVLNWSVSPDSDKRLRGIIPLKESETVVALIAVGHLPDDFLVAASPRKPLQEVLVWH